MRAILPRSGVRLDIRLSALPKRRRRGCGEPPGGILGAPFFDRVPSVDPHQTAVFTRLFARLSERDIIETAEAHLSGTTVQHEPVQPRFRAGYPVGAYRTNRQP